MRLQATLSLLTLAALLLAAFAREPGLANAEPNLEARGTAGHNAYSVLSAALKSNKSGHKSPKTTKHPKSHPSVGQVHPIQTSRSMSYHYVPHHAGGKVHKSHSEPKSITVTLTKYDDDHELLDWHELRRRGLKEDDDYDDLSDEEWSEKGFEDEGEYDDEGQSDLRDEQTDSMSSESSDDGLRYERVKSRMVPGAVWPSILTPAFARGSEASGAERKAGGHDGRGGEAEHHQASRQHLQNALQHLQNAHGHLQAAHEHQQRASKRSASPADDDQQGHAGHNHPSRTGGRAHGTGHRSQKAASSIHAKSGSSPQRQRHSHNSGEGRHAKSSPLGSQKSQHSPHSPKPGDGPRSSRSKHDKQSANGGSPDAPTGHKQKSPGSGSGHPKSSGSSTGHAKSSDSKTSPSDKSSVQTIFHHKLASPTTD